MAAALGCADGDGSRTPKVEAGTVGRVQLELRTPDGQTISQVDYTVDDAAGGEVLSKSINVSRPYATASVELSLRAGEDYTIELTAQTAQDGTCTGESAPFDVVASETTQVMLVLACSGVGPSDTEQNGHVVINATVETPAATVCPDIESAAVSPLVTAVNDTVALSATGSASGMAFTWSASSGTLTNAATAEATLRCTAPGEVTVALEASLGDCSDTETFHVTCLDNVCRDLGRTCHNVDPGSGPLHECHDVGHSNDPAACAAIEDECVQGCGAALCTALAEMCHDVASLSPELEHCHHVAHEGDPVACYEIGRACWDACSAAEPPAGGSGGAGEAGAGGSGGAAGGGEAGSTPPGPIAVAIQFAAEVGGAPFACGTTYPGLGTAATTMTPVDFRFYVQDLRLVTASGDEVPVVLDVAAPWQNELVALIDFATDTCPGATPETNGVITGTVPAGDYVGVVFRNGVPIELNHDDPTTLTAPLTAPQMQWSWLSGFRYMRAELQTPEATLSLVHSGATGCSGSTTAGTVSCARQNRNEVRLTGFDPATNVIVADLGAIFAGTDLSLGTECHGSGSQCAAMYSALGIDLATGAPLATQTTYHVE